MFKNKKLDHIWVLFLSQNFLINIFPHANKSIFNSIIFNYCIVSFCVKNQSLIIGQEDCFQIVLLQTVFQWSHSSSTDHHFICWNIYDFLLTFINQFVLVIQYCKQCWYYERHHITKTNHRKYISNLAFSLCKNINSGFQIFIWRMLITRKTLSLKKYGSTVSHLSQKSQISCLIITYYFPLLKICISFDTIFFLHLSKTPPAHPNAQDPVKPPGSAQIPWYFFISVQWHRLPFSFGLHSPLPTLLFQYHKGKIVERHYLSLVSFTVR